jgi:hypothetical protein
MTSITPETSRQVIIAMLAVRGMGMGFCMMPSMSAAYVTLAPERIARATSVSNVMQRVASGLGIAITATVLSARITANLPHLPAGAVGAAGATGSNLAAANLPAPIKTLLLDQAAKGFSDTFWVVAGLAALAFPLTLLLRRARRPEEVRSYALRQLAEGIVLGAAARRLRNAATSKLATDVAAQPVLVTAALDRLRKGQTLLRAGTAASGMLPHTRLGLMTRLSFGVVSIAAVIAMSLAVSHGYRTPAVPSLPTAAQAHTTAATH